MKRRNSFDELACPSCGSSWFTQAGSGTSAGLSAEAFGVKKATVYAAPWSLGCSQPKGVCRGRKDRHYRD